VMLINCRGFCQSEETSADLNFSLRAQYKCS
jgi:hypothetical protein